VSQDKAVQVFKGMLQNQSMNHLLLYGPPGTGKTSIVLAFAKELFGERHYKKRILELNASDDRGINKIREKV
jgi:replication factor C subunit 2/4